MNAIFWRKQIDWFDVLRDVAVLWCLSFLCGIIGSLVIRMPPFQDIHPVRAGATANQIAFLIGFTFSGCMKRRGKIERLQHLGVVALGICQRAHKTTTQRALENPQFVVGG